MSYQKKLNFLAKWFDANYPEEDEVQQDLVKISQYITKLENCVSGMECSCLPYATPENGGMCDRCKILLLRERENPL